MKLLKNLKLPLFKETDLFLSEYVKRLKSIAEAIQNLQGEKIHIMKGYYLNY